MNAMALIVGLGGIGTAVAQRLGEEGVNVYGTYHSRESSASHAKAAVPEGRWLGSAQLDVASPEQIKQVIAGVPTLMESTTCLVVTTGHRHDLEFFRSQDPGASKSIVETELIGPMNVVREFLNATEGSPYPRRIVLIGSDSGKAGTLGDAASSAARAGLTGFARSIARETSRTDTTINVVSPGPTDTELLHSMTAGDSLTAKVMNGTVKAIPKGRAAAPEEIAEAVAYFLGSHSGFTTGQVLSVSGGLTMS